MDKYGLIGYPLGHSFSSNYFNEKFANEGIYAHYYNFEIPSIDRLPEVLASNPELVGLNVTIPYKQKVMSFLDFVRMILDYLLILIDDNSRPDDWLDIRDKQPLQNVLAYLGYRSE